MKLYWIIKTFLSRHLSPARIFILSFAAVILLGTIFLMMPYSVLQKNLSFTDALFTATSAVCVTGLAVLDIGKDLSVFGQVVTMFLFQIGGLGIITFSIILFALMGRGISFKGREVTQSVLLYGPRKDFHLMIKKVLFYTLIIEGVGSLILFVRFAQDFSVGQALYSAVYHAISAFNNCGYSLFSDNFMHYQNDVVVNFTIMGLIIMGGIGFIVQQEVVARLRNRKNKLSLHSRIVLFTTAVLILGGAILFYFFEINNVLQGVSLKTAFLTSCFQSVTARTAGFNTVDIGTLTNSTILILLFLMFVGASPGSTGGGVKTTSFALLLLLVVNRIRGNENVNISNRTIPKELIERTIAIIFSAAVLIGIVTAVLLFFSDSRETPLALRHEFIEYVFETFSAFGTVGLSMGVTPKLNDMQKYAVILMMFIGRVGPLTMAFAWYSSRNKSITYAEESVMVG